MSKGKSKKNKGNKQHPKHRYSRGKQPSKPTNPADVVKKEERKPVDMTGQVTLSFDATDTLFFRESRPMESMGELHSVFPPPVRTLAGAVRSLIGEAMQVNWREFNETHWLTEYIGYGDDLGGLSFQGAWLSCENEQGKRERLYPAPLHLMQKEKKIVDALQLHKKGTWCDLGRNVRLPKLPEGTEAGCKPLENTWLTQIGFEAVLQGNLPKDEHIKPASELFERESRLGIARDNATRTVEESMLYQTQHIRPKAGVVIELDASGLPADMPQEAMIRLGGEGRSAGVTANSPQPAVFPKTPTGNKQTGGLMLYLLTPLHFQSTGTGSDWQPLPDFKRVEPDDENSETCWEGEINGVELVLYGAVTGKALREGGWDMAKHQPRPVTSLIPAGSVFFCKAKNDGTQAAINTLHNTQMGKLTEYGYGHLAAGLWLQD